MTKGKLLEQCREGRESLEGRPVTLLRCSSEAFLFVFGADCRNLVALVDRVESIAIEHEELVRTNA